MRNPVWFHARRLGGVPIHWSPVCWQGWAVVAALMLGLVTSMLLWGTTAPGRVVWVGCALVAATIAVAALTDGDAPGDDGRDERRPGL